MANEWNKTALVVEFETMLRRRLRSGAAPVAPCAGFDLDAASAYLEGALGGSHRAGYESHLAGCATCRRHLIELARLAQTAPRAKAQPVTAPDRIPAWNRWKEAVAVWFDLSSRNFKWRMAGVAGAAFAILIAALGALSWRQASNYADVAATSSATPPILVEPGGQPLPSPTPEPSLQYVASPVARDSMAIYQGPSQVSVPTPPVGPKENAPKLAVDALRESLTLSEGQSVEAPVAAKPSDARAGQNPPPQPRASADMASSGRTGEPVQGARITPPHGYNPMNPVPPELDPRHRTLVLGDEGRIAPVNPQSPEPPPRPKEPLKLPGFVRTWLPRIKAKPKSESQRKKSDEASEDESPKPMLIPIRDKVFRFEKGVLIDREYNPEMQEWRVWTLRRGSEAYKQVLANEPLLKEFFDRGPILIVWKNRIYKVLK